MIESFASCLRKAKCVISDPYDQSDVPAPAESVTSSVTPTTCSSSDDNKSLARRLSFSSVTTAGREAVEPQNVLEEVSLVNIKKRIHRLMQPRANGSLKIPKEIRDEWLQTDNQDKMVRDYVAAGHDKAQIEHQIRYTTILMR